MTLRASVYGRQSSGKAKSIREQLVAGATAITENGWSHAGDYSDGTSASRHGTKKRDDWERLLTDLEAGAFDILVLWESSRGDRTLTSWARFLDLCRDQRVHVHVIADDHTYDLNRPRDWKTLATAGVDAAAETDLLSIRVKRGHAGAAAEGKPPGGPTPYGYKRTFDPDTGKRTGQKPHEVEAPFVAEIFERIAAGNTVLGLANEFNDRQVPRSNGYPWTPGAIRTIVHNPAYFAGRTLNGRTHRGTWEPLVDEGLWLAAQQVLDDPERRKTRPGRQKHLLSYLARCGVCDRWVNQVVGCYRCLNGHVSIPKEPVDEIVSTLILDRLSRADAEPILEAGSDLELREARVEAARLRSQLEQWRASAIRGETSPESLAVIERGLLDQIAAADETAKALQVPAPLRALLTPDADVRERWSVAPVTARRLVIKALCEIRIGSGRKGVRPAKVDLVDWYLPRLGGSRWNGDDRTWAELAEG